MAACGCDDQINGFSKGNMASLAILRHLLSFFSRTENSVLDAPPSDA